MVQSCTIRSFLLLLMSISLASSGCMANNPQSDRQTKVIFGNQIPSHPRLLFSESEEIKIKELRANDELVGDLFELLREKADLLLSEPLIEYSLRDVNYTQDILMISREHVYRIFTLSLAYRLLGDQKYGRKAEENLVNVCNYPNWNPRHYLDVAEMTTAVAVGYDWLHDFLSEETKALIVKSIKEKALVHAVREYETGDMSSWAKRETNWNVVCNTGMILGALAIAEEDPKLTESVISSGAGFVPNCLNHYAPDGVCYEGPGYWNYTNVYLTLLLKSLNDNLQHDFGISDLPGVKNSVTYYIESVSPGGRVFNFANSGGTSPSASPVFFYFSKTFDQPGAAVFYKEMLKNIVKNPGSAPKWHFFLSIPWYDSAVVTSMEKSPKLQVFDNLYNPILVFKGDNISENPVYLAAKGGAPDKAHQQLDVGTFVIETNGVRWTDDLGSDKYSLPGFWDYKPDGQRWHYFRNTNFSHNTLSIDGKLQHSAGTGKILKSNTQAEKPFCVIDMTTAYANQASSVHRGFRLLDNDIMLIQDEVTLDPAASAVEWSVISPSEISIKGNTAIMKKDGYQFFVLIVQPAEGSFLLEEAKTFTPGENPLSGYSILKIKTNSHHKNQTIQVAMGSNLNSLLTISEKNLQPILNWQ